MSARSGLLDWGVLAGLTVSWGSAFAALRLAVGEIHPFWNTTLRLALASAMLGLLVLLTRKAVPPLRSVAWRWYVLSGVLGMALPFALFGVAATTLPSAVTAICNGGTPIFVAALAHVFAGERLTGRRAAGVGLGFIGLMVLVGGDAVRGFEAGHTPALLLAVGGAALYAVSSVSIRRAPQVPALTGAFMVCLTGFIASVPLALLGAAPPSVTQTSAGAWIALAYLGLVSSATAMIAWIWLLNRRGAVFASMATYGAPLVAMAIGVTWLGERPRTEAFVALGLVLAGMLLANIGSRVQPRMEPEHI